MTNQHPSRRSRQTLQLEKFYIFSSYFSYSYFWLRHLKCAQSHFEDHVYGLEFQAFETTIDLCWKTFPQPEHDKAIRRKRKGHFRSSVVTETKSCEQQLAQCWGLRHGSWGKTGKQHKKNVVITGRDWLGSNWKKQHLSWAACWRRARQTGMSHRYHSTTMSPPFILDLVNLRWTKAAADLTTALSFQPGWWTPLRPLRYPSPPSPHHSLTPPSRPGDPDLPRSSYSFPEIDSGLFNNSQQGIMPRSALIVSADSYPPAGS